MGSVTRGTFPHLSSHLLLSAQLLLLLLPLLCLHASAQAEVNKRLFRQALPSSNPSFQRGQRFGQNKPLHRQPSRGVPLAPGRKPTRLGELPEGVLNATELSLNNAQLGLVVQLGQPELVIKHESGPNQEDKFTYEEALTEGRFFRGMFTNRDQCAHNGLAGSCEFRLWCLIQSDKIIVDGKCGSYWYTCCVPNVASVRSDAIRQIAQFREAPRLTSKNEECGVQRISQFSKRIIGGDEAKFGEFPWQAHIRIAGFQCGGVLLNHFFIATAAHCVHKARLPQITVHLGEFDTKDTGKYSEPFPKETFSVIEKRIHPSFKYMLTQPDRFDIAVLRLNRPVIYRENILPICLPDISDDFTGKIGVVAGWGKTDNSFGKTGTNILRKVDVPIITNPECLRWHHHKGIDVKLHYEMFCAGHAEGQRDACLGDSGGPLVVYDKQRWVLAGITSAGFGCAVDHQPGIYHKVSITSSWLTANLRP